MHRNLSARSSRTHCPYPMLQCYHSLIYDYGVSLLAVDEDLCVWFHAHMFVKSYEREIIWFHMIFTLKSFNQFQGSNRRTIKELSSASSLMQMQIYCAALACSPLPGPRHSQRYVKYAWISRRLHPRPHLRDSAIFIFSQFQTSQSGVAVFRLTCQMVTFMPLFCASTEAINANLWSL